MNISHEAVFVRRRRLVVLGFALFLVLAVLLAGCLTSGDDPTDGASAGDTDPPADAAGSPDPQGTSPDQDSQTDEADETEESGAEETDSPEETTAPALPSDTTVLEQVDYITGAITPKSVVASSQGTVIANNMMYSHTVTVYDGQTRELVKTIDDGLELADFGVQGHPGTSRGAPVEAAWTADGQYAYVSNYSMYGQGFGPHGIDACTPADGYDASYLYRLDAETLEFDQVIEVGSVPKFVAITPDQSTVLVSNWCDHTLSVVDREQAEEVDVIDIGAAPRGIEVSADSSTAYVTAMYGNKLMEVDLEAGTSELYLTTGAKPRHLNMSPDGEYMYLASSGADTVSKIELATGEVVDEVVSGREPRSMAISPDGTALYVVNYYEPSMSKIRTSDMEVLEKVPTDASPIGVTYEPTTSTVWVANYGGSIIVFDDSRDADGNGPSQAPTDG